MAIVNQKQYSPPSAGRERPATEGRPTTQSQPAALSCDVVHRHRADGTRERIVPPLQRDVRPEIEVPNAARGVAAGLIIVLGVVAVVASLLILIAGGAQ